MEGTADSSQRQPNLPQHGAASPVFIEVPDEHGVTEVFATDRLFRTTGDDAAFTDLARSIANSLDVPQPGVLYFEYNKRATSGHGLIGLLREVKERGLDYVVVDWQRTVRVAGHKRSCSLDVQDGEMDGRRSEGRARLRRASSKLAVRHLHRIMCLRADMAVVAQAPQAASSDAAILRHTFKPPERP